MTDTERLLAAIDRLAATGGAPPPAGADAAKTLRGATPAAWQIIAEFANVGAPSGATIDAVCDAVHLREP